MDLSQQLGYVAKSLGCSYTVKGQPISYEKVFAVDGLLPAFLRRADQLCSFCLGYGLGINFEASAGMVGATVKLDDKIPNSLRLLCVTDVMIEVMQNAPSRDAVPLDEFMVR